MYKYFLNIANEEELKKKFRALSKKFYPLPGNKEASEEEFIAMKREYDKIKNTKPAYPLGVKFKTTFKTEYKAKTNSRTVLDEVIDMQKKYQWKMGAVYFRFLDIMVSKKLKISFDDLLEIEKYCGYKGGWARIKYVELKLDNVAI